MRYIKVGCIDHPFTGFFLAFIFPSRINFEILADAIPAWDANSLVVKS